MIGQIQNQDLAALAAMTGFDPRTDLTELMCASNGAPGAHTGLAIASGKFDVNKITALSATKKSVTETYNGVIIIETPEKTDGIAFLNPSLLVAGDVANVKAAIDREKSPTSPLPTPLSRTW